METHPGKILFPLPSQPRLKKIPSLGEISVVGPVTSYLESFGKQPQPQLILTVWQNLSGDKLWSPHYR